MRRAAWVEVRGAFRAFIGCFVGSDRQFGPTVPAQNRRTIPLLAWPLLCGMVRRLRVAQVARIVAVTAGEADRDDVEFGGVVNAPGVIVDDLAIDSDLGHRSFPSSRALFAALPA